MKDVTDILAAILMGVFGFLLLFFGMIVALYITTGEIERVVAIVTNALENLDSKGVKSE